MKILGQRILIEPVSAQESRGGIIIPACAEQENATGVVVAIGSGIKESRPYKKGSVVFLAMYKGEKLEVNGKKMLLVDQEDVCGVMINNSFHPIGDKILLRPIEKIDSGGIIVLLPDWSDDKSNFQDGEIGIFKVHLVGSGIKTKKGNLVPFLVKVGDTVYAKPFAGRDVDTLEGTFKLVQETDILGIVDEPKMATTGCQTN